MEADCEKLLKVHIQSVSLWDSVHWLDRGGTFEEGSKTALWSTLGEDLNRCLRLQKDTQEPSEGMASGIWDLPGVTRTICAEKESVLKPCSFSEGSGATDLLACTRARQHARSSAPAHKSWSA